MTTTRHSLPTNRPLRVAGLMSGTSADGVDVAIVEMGRGGVRLLAHDTVPYAASVRTRVFALFDPETARVDDVCHMNFVIGELFARALTRVAEKNGVKLDSIDLIGSHGQTIFHIPEGRRFGRRRIRSTLQIGEPSVIAERTGITTVADFRPRDVAAGGDGAPLVPYADYVLFRDRRKSRAIQNIGGIANVTFLPARCKIEEIVAFDTGPGNMMIDRAAFLTSRGRKRYDAGGKLAAKGSVNESLLAELMRHPFLRRRPPKSTGRETFGLPFCNAVYKRWRKKGVAALDLVATFTAFTAKSISDAYRRFLPDRSGGTLKRQLGREAQSLRPSAHRQAGLDGATHIDEVILCGGGARNDTLRRMLEEELHPVEVVLTDEYGISADAREAMSFAILAYETIRGNANNVPSATGARRPVVLGKIIPGKR